MVGSGIYVITNLSNRKVYIGQAVEVHKRWQAHKAALRARYHVNKHLESSWHKYGEGNFLFEILEKCPIELLDEREAYWIDLFNALDTRFGYNKEKPT